MQQNRSTVPVTDDQRDQLRRLVQDAVDRAIAEGILDKNGAQKLIVRGDELQRQICGGIETFSRGMQFFGEKVESSLGYFSGHKPLFPNRQIDRLRELFPGIGHANEKLAEQPLPAGAEGYFAFPRWEAIARTYPEAVQMVFKLMNEAYDGRFCNHRQDVSTIRQIAATSKMLRRLGEEQDGYDILVVPSQFGVRYGGCSARWAREAMDYNEFPLGTFAIGTMLLTHEDRLKHKEDLGINSAGDEFSRGGGEHSGHSPYFFCTNNKVQFDVSWCGNPSGQYGSPSAFLSELVV